MDQAVDAEEVYLVNDRRDQHERREIDRMVGPAQPRHVAVGEAAEQEHFHRGPARNADEERAQDVVDILALEPEDVGGMVGRELAVELELRPLLAPDVEEQLDRAVHDEDRRRVHGVEPERPAPAQRLHRLDLRHDPVPVGQRGRHVEGVPREQVARQPLQELDRPRRPRAQGRQLHGLMGGPVAALVPGSEREIVHASSSAMASPASWALSGKGPCIHSWNVAMLNNL